MNNPVTLFLNATPLLNAALIWEPDVLADLVRLKTECLWPAYSRQYDDIIQFSDRTFSPQPMHAVTASQVDDEDAALDVCVASGSMTISNRQI